MGEELTIVRKPAPVTAPTLRDLLAVLFRQRRLALLSFVAIFFAVLGYGVFAPSYQAHMNVLVRRGRVDPLVTPAPTPSPMFQRDEITEEELNSQVELLRDDEILRTVLQSPGLAGDPWYERFLGGNEEVRLARAVRRLARRLGVEAIRKTNLIQVVYSAPDPAHAAAVLHALAHAYLERQQRVRRPSGEYEFFEQQVAQSRRGLLDAEFRLMDFSSDQGVVSAARYSFCRPIWKVSPWHCWMPWERGFACWPAIFPKIVNWWTDRDSRSGTAIGMTWNACCDC